MKKTFTIFSVLFAIPVFFVSAYTSPGKPSGFVNDFAGIIDSGTKTSIESRLSVYEKEYGNEISVVTVGSISGETIETYATKLFEEWGIGKSREDNGVLLLVAPNEREVRIEVGYGLEGYLTDAQSSIIVRDILIPSFRSGDYSKGVSSAVGSIIGVLEGSPLVESSPRIPSDFMENILGVFFIILIQIIPIMMYSKSWWLGGVLGFILGFLIWSLYAALAFAVIGLILDYVLSKKYGGKKRPTSGVGGFFFGGRGGGGGGFGGFGGGMSGGGGSSGRW